LLWNTITRKLARIAVDAKYANAALTADAAEIAENILRFRKATMSFLCFRLALNPRLGNRSVHHTHLAISQLPRPLFREV
jgi:hypothetical protein